jgi:hypothetical protein
MGEKNYEKKSPSPLETKPKQKPDPKAVGGTVLKGLGVKRPGSK